MDYQVDQTLNNSFHSASRKTNWIRHSRR